MPTHHDQGTEGGIFFATATCWDWLPLIHRTGLYDHIYQWMYLATGKGCRMLGFVIMPNHLHLLLHVPEGLSVNTLLANMKRFAAYEVVKRLKAVGDETLLTRLKKDTTPGDRARGQEHRIWRTSSDLKRCDSERFVLQKLQYIHANPVSGKWSLAESDIAYLHSSAGFYQTGNAHHAPLIHYHEVVHGTAVQGASGSLRRP